MKVYVVELESRKGTAGVSGVFTTFGLAQQHIDNRYPDVEPITDTMWGNEEQVVSINEYEIDKD